MLRITEYCVLSAHSHYLSLSPFFLASQIQKALHSCGSNLTYKGYTSSTGKNTSETLQLAVTPCEGC